ncbi:adhesion G-protein coupled receptor D1-like isoform X2 [Oculina patagonica]
MNFSVPRFYLLFQIAVFVGELSRCSSVTYHPSSDTCKGSQLENKCEESGERLARINDSASLEKVKQAITGDEKYWTALRYHENKKYCWGKDDCDEPESVPSSILDTAAEGSWRPGWYCFWISKAERKLQVQICSDNQRYRYICEKAASNNKTTPTKEKLSAEDQLRQYVSAISALNVSEETSLQSAANTTNNLFSSLKEDEVEGKDVNVLLATQELEKFAIRYGKIHQKANESKVVSKELFALKIQKVAADNKKAIIFSVNETGYSTKEGSASISLPPKVFKGQEAIVVSILYNGIKQWVPDAKDVQLDGIMFKELKMGSRIIATTIDPKPTGTLEENVTISFTHDKGVKKGDVPHCVFWDFTLQSELNGSWASTGCSMIQTVDREITCSCNHLTNFAVLMQVGDTKVSKDHRLALEVITYIGCGLSLAGELLTLIAYCALMNLKQEQVQIRFNLVVAIAIAQIVFLSGVGASETKGACVFVAALIHYFYLAGFAWMLFEGVYLYLMVVKVFNTVIRMRLFYAFAWGFPLAMVVLSLAIASGQDGGVNSYVHGDFCWVSFTNNLIWTFAAPVLAVCLINATILARVLYEIIKMQSDKTSELDKMRQGLKALAVLFPLLGLTWLFGILTVTDAGLVFQYIFTILNSLQGFFIFLIHVLRNSDVRASFFRKKQKWKESRNFSSSRVTSQGTDLWSTKMTSEDGQELNSKRNDGPRSSVAGYSNVSIVEQERSLTPVQM